MASLFTVACGPCFDSLLLSFSKGLASKKLQMFLQQSWTSNDTDKETTGCYTSWGTLSKQFCLYSRANKENFRGRRYINGRCQKPVCNWIPLYYCDSDHIPNAPCMDYLLTLGEQWPHEQGELWVDIPIPWSIWVTRMGFPQWPSHGFKRLKVWLLYVAKIQQNLFIHYLRKPAWYSHGKQNWHVCWQVRLYEHDLKLGLNHWWIYLQGNHYKTAFRFSFFPGTTRKPRHFFCLKNPVLLLLYLPSQQPRVQGNRTSNPFPNHLRLSWRRFGGSGRKSSATRN